MAACSGCRVVVLWAALWQVLLPWTHGAAAVGASTPSQPKAAAPPVVAGPVSKVEDAKLFQIYYGQSFKVIKNNKDGKSYLLMQNTSRMATRTKYCTGRIKSFVIPLANYSVDTATASPVSFFELLGVLENLKGITSDQVASQCVLQSYTSGNVQLVNRTDAQKLTQFSAHFMSNIDEDKGCNFVAYVPSEEGTPLQRAEWIKYLGAFTNSEDRANAVYDAIKTNYLCLSKAAANISTRFKPIVAWIEYTQGMWTFVKGNYNLQYVTDAGAEIVDATITNKRFNISDSEDMDNFHAILCTVDVVIDQTYASEPAEYKLSTFLENINVGRDSCFSFVANRSIWRFDKRIGDSKTLGNGSSLSCFSMLKNIPRSLDQFFLHSALISTITMPKLQCHIHFCLCNGLMDFLFFKDWFDGAISQPQLVLADLIEVFFPTGNYTTIYFRNLAKEEGVTEIGPEMCSRSISTPMEPTILPCQ